MIRKIALLSGAVLALSLVPVPMALADAIDCDAAKKLVVSAQVRLDNRAAEERVEENAALKAAKDALDAAQDALDALGADATEAVRQAARDLVQEKRTLRDAAKDALDVDSRRLSELRAALTVAVQEKDRVCGGVTTTPPAPAPEDVDCNEVSDDEAQRILDADTSDPNDLDSDNDGVACETETDIEIVRVPSGAVDTGGGPA